MSILLQCKHILLGLLIYPLDGDTMGMFDGLKNKVGDIDLKSKITDRDKPDFVDKIIKLENETALLETYITKTDKALQDDPDNATLTRLHEQYKNDMQRSNNELTLLRSKAESLKEKLEKELEVMKTEKRIEDDALEEIEMMYSKGLLREEDYEVRKKKVVHNVSQYEHKIEKNNKILEYIAQVHV